LSPRTRAEESSPGWSEAEPWVGVLVQIHQACFSGRQMMSSKLFRPLKRAPTFFYYTTQGRTPLHFVSLRLPWAIFFRRLCRLVVGIHCVLVHRNVCYFLYRKS